MKKLLVAVLTVMLVLSSVAAYAACDSGCKKSCCSTEKKEGCSKADPNSK